jgi:hypothetical protein
VGIDTEFVIRTNRGFVTKGKAHGQEVTGRAPLLRPLTGANRATIEVKE